MTPAELRLVAAIEERRAAARALGIDTDLGELDVPLGLRVDAYLWRTSMLLADRSWQRIDQALRAERSVAA